MGHHDARAADVGKAVGGWRVESGERGITSTVVLRLPAFEASDELGTSAAQGFDEEFPTRGEAATWRHREGELEAIGAITKRLRQVRVRIKVFWDWERQIVPDLRERFVEQTHARMAARV